VNAEHAFVLLSRVLGHYQNILFRDQVLDDVLDLLGQFLHLLHVLGLAVDLSICESELLHHPIYKISLFDRLGISFPLHILHCSCDRHRILLVLVVGDPHFATPLSLFLHLLSRRLRLLRAQSSLSFAVSLHIKEIVAIRASWSCLRVHQVSLVLGCLLLQLSLFSAINVDLLLVIFELEVPLDQVDI